jgi:hypothetical protein
MRGLAAKMWAGVTTSSCPLRAHSRSSFVRAWSSALAWYQYCGARPVGIEGASGTADAAGAGAEDLGGRDSLFLVAKTSYMSCSSMM